VVLLDGLHVTLAANDLKHGEQELTAASQVLGTSAGSWTPAHIKAAQERQKSAAAALTRGRDGLRSDPGLSALSGLPRARDQVRAARDLAAAGLGTAAAFDDLIAVARVYDAAHADTAPPGQRLINLVAVAGKPLERADAHLKAAVATLDADAGLVLIGSLASKVESARAALHRAEGPVGLGATAGKFLPAALGDGSPKTYLLLLENPSEIRPAGGLAANVGTARFDKGTPTIEIHDEGAVDKAIGDHYPAPYPMSRFVKSLQISDAGWDPDFPTSARLSEQMYREATATAVDGTISIDPYAIAAVLGVTGPVDAPGFGQFDQANFFSKTNHIVNVAGQASTQAKEQLGPIAKIILTKALALPTSQWPQLLTAIQGQVAARHVQIYLHDPAPAEVAAQGHADGALASTPGDQLMVVDANLGGGKMDYFLHKTAELKVQVPPTGLSPHELRLNYDLPLDEPDEIALTNGAGNYRNYVRIYLPLGSSIRRFSFLADGKPSPDGGLDRVTSEHGQMVVLVFLRVQRGHGVQLTLNYVVPLPPARSYDLFMQKQAGIPGRSTTVRVAHPFGTSSQVFPLDRDGQWRIAW